METESDISPRDSVIAFLKTLPADVSLEEILYHLYIKQQILEGQEELRNGQSYTHEQVKEMLQEWFQ